MHKIDLSNFMLTNIITVNRINNTTVKTQKRVNRKMCALAFKAAGRTVYQNETGSYVSDPNHVVLLLKGTSYVVNFETFGYCIMIEFECNPDFNEQCITSFYIKNSSILHNLFLSIEKEWTFKKVAYKKIAFQLYTKY